MDYVVDSTLALSSTLKFAQGGDTIWLQPGAYAGLNLSNVTVPGGVTITSVDAQHQAVLMDLTLTNDRGLTFSNVEMIATGKAGYGFSVTKSNDIHFDHVYVHGSLDNDATNDISGISFLQTNNLSVTNSTFEQLSQGVGTSSGSNIVLSGNVIHDVRMTGLVFAQVDHVSVTANTISNLRPTPTTHPDAIQFFTTGTTQASHDIDISNNVIVKGDGEGTQGIFLRDQLGTLPFQHVTIDNNLIVGTGYGGIYLMGVKGVELSGNVLTSNPGKTNNTFFLIQGGDDVTVTNNQTALAIGFDKVTNFVQSGNLIQGTVDDNGVAAMQDWSLLHPASASLVAPFLPPPPPPPPPPELAYADLNAMNMDGYGMNYDPWGYNNWY